MDPQFAKSKVAGPAIGLIVAALIGMMMQLFSAGLNIFTMVGGTAVALEQGADGLGLLANGALGLAINALALLMGGVILFGAFKMKNLASKNLAMAAAIISMVPCLSPCCPLGLIFGIWSLVAMSDPEVKSAFEANEGGANF
jgi:hypothetical protein